MSLPAVFAGVDVVARRQTQSPYTNAASRHPLPSSEPNPPPRHRCPPPSAAVGAGAPIPTPLDAALIGAGAEAPAAGPLPLPPPAVRFLDAPRVVATSMFMCIFVFLEFSNYETLMPFHSHSQEKHLVSFHPRHARPILIMKASAVVLRVGSVGSGTLPPPPPLALFALDPVAFRPAGGQCPTSGPASVPLVVQYPIVLSSPHFGLLDYASPADRLHSLARISAPRLRPNPDRPTAAAPPQPCVSG
ncbi:hypothetical protein GUJ93_ZPchr0008g12431 [Zizania palustris]|uniref:Uncharacterized protein n=1 Tax=Zizania palustris TaxID=103762 RepID=A0A8J5R4Y2_ZIZPA|nr:hypothetical protein GUJ93_ZPchr0008g12431 [Zizania palustris]